MACDSVEFKQPLGCFFFVFILSLPFSGWAGSNHSGSALRGGLRLSDHPAERAGQAHAVLAPFPHQHLPHQVSNLGLYGEGGSRLCFSTCQGKCSSLGPGNVIINPSDSLCSVGVSSDVVLVCIAGTGEHTNVPLHLCGVL